MSDIHKGLAGVVADVTAVSKVNPETNSLLYRGYPIEQLAEHSSFLEVAYLLYHGELPTPDQMAQWSHAVRYHTMVHEGIKRFLDGFRYDAHPMGVLVSTIAGLATFYLVIAAILTAALRALEYRLARHQRAPATTAVTAGDAHVQA